ncbi:MAG: FAD:protein FMN transferase [Bacteroidetes bacterium]|nr:FAD:protein FMN transferase [Bacteroidota bacterium]
MISEVNYMILKELNKKGSVICLFFVFIFTGCSTPKEELKDQRLAGNALGTTYHITYIGAQFVGLEKSIDSILTAFNYGLSTYDPNSFISQFNSNKPINKAEVKPGFEHFKVMINKSEPIVDATGGAFDPSAAQLFKLYDSFKKQNRIIDTFSMQLAKAFKGFEPVIFDSEGNLIKDRFKRYNFNAIAKGYFVDLLSELLTNHGYRNHMVEVGGEVRCAGSNSAGQAWNIGINRPEVGAKPTDYFEVISLSGKSMATSGNYQNFYIVNDSVIGHTMDPRTGKPVISDLKSASIMHAECAVADAYATACMVLGLDQSIELIEADSSLSAFFIFEENGQLEGVHVK